VFSWKGFIPRHCIAASIASLRLTAMTRLGALHGEAMSPFSAPAAEHFSAGFLFHPNKKSMRPFALAIVRLERTFHDTNVLLLKVNRDYK